MRTYSAPRPQLPRPRRLQAYMILQINGLWRRACVPGFASLLAGNANVRRSCLEAVSEVFIGFPAARIPCSQAAVIIALLPFPAGTHRIPRISSLRGIRIPAALPLAQLCASPSHFWRASPQFAPGFQRLCGQSHTRNRRVPSCEEPGTTFYFSSSINSFLDLFHYNPQDFLEGHYV